MFLIGALVGPFRYCVDQKREISRWGWLECREGGVVSVAAEGAAGGVQAAAGGPRVRPGCGWHPRTPFCRWLGCGLPAVRALPLRFCRLGHPCTSSGCIQRVHSSSTDPL